MPKTPDPKEDQSVMEKEEQLKDSQQANYIHWTVLFREIGEECVRCATRRKKYIEVLMEKFRQSAGGGSSLLDHDGGPGWTSRGVCAWPS